MVQLVEKIQMDQDILKNIIDRTRDEVLFIESRVNQLRSRHNAKNKMTDRLENELVQSELAHNKEVLLTERISNSHRRASSEISKSLSLAKRAIREAA